MGADATFIAAALLCLLRLHTDIAFEKDQIRKIDVENTIEYRMAKAFERLEAGNRVFAPASVSLWMNMFTNQPQLNGCCDQSIPRGEHRLATFLIYSGLNAGDRDATVSTLWLKAYGAHAVGVTGKHSTEWFNRRAPVDGLDTGPLERYVGALENPAYPEVEFVWINPHEARAEARLAAKQLLSVQISYDPGWHARVNGMERTITSDALGMMVVDPRCAADCC